MYLDAGHEVDVNLNFSSRESKPEARFSKWVHDEGACVQVLGWLSAGGSDRHSSMEATSAVPTRA